MCFTIWAQQAVSTAPAPPNLRRESSLPDRKVLLERIEALDAKVQRLQATQAQDMGLVGMQFAEADAKVDAVASGVEAKLAAERQARQQGIDGVHSKLEAERIDRQRAINEVQGRQDQDMHMMNMQFDQVESRISNLDDALRAVMVLYLLSPRPRLV